MSQGSFKPIYPNPYIVGNPIRSRDMFFGRVDEFRHISQALDHGQKTALIVLFGERRSGKSSILYQIQNGQLGQAFLPLFIDLQIMAGIANEAEFFGRIITDTGKALGKAGPEIAPYILRPDDSNPAEGFRQYLRALQAHFPGRALLVLIDEYEILENKITEGCLSRHVLTFFGGLLESEQVSFVFTGSRKLELHNAELWGSALLQKATSRKISFLTPDDTARLVTQPLANKVTFAPAVIEQIYALTAGQPFYTQLICQNLVYHLNEVKKYFVDCADLEKVVEGILENPPPQLIFNWGEHAAEHKLMLALLAEFSRKPGRYLSTTSIRYRIQRSKLDLVLNDAKLKTWLTDLCKDEYLLQQDYRFSFRLDLFRRWIRHDHNIWQVKKEIGQEELDRICEKEKEKKEKKKKIIIVLERIALAAAIIVAVGLGKLLYDEWQKRDVVVQANGGPFRFVAIKASNGDTVKDDFSQKELSKHVFKTKLLKNNKYVLKAFLLANNEPDSQTVTIADKNNNINFAFKKYRVIVVTDAREMEATLGDTIARFKPEPWKHIIAVCAGAYELRVKDTSTGESQTNTIRVFQNDSININFGRVVVALQAKFPFEYRYKGGNGSGIRQTKNLYSAELRGCEKGRIKFTFLNLKTKEEIQPTYTVLLDTTIMIKWDSAPVVINGGRITTNGTPQTHYYELKISTRPDSAKVLFDGEIVGYTPFDTTLVENTYSIMLEKNGYDPYSFAWKLKEKVTVPLIELQQQFGFFKVLAHNQQGKALADVKIEVDDNPVGETPKFKGKSLPVGLYKIKAMHPKYLVANQTVFIKKNDTTEVVFKLEEKK